MPETTTPPAPGNAPAPGASGTPPQTPEQRTAEKLFDANAAGGSTPPPTPPAGSTPPASGTPPKPDQGQGADGKPADKPADDVVPEAYDLKLPDGSLLDSKAMERTATFAKENGLTNKEAQAVLERENEAVVSYANSQQEMWIQKNEKWRDELKSDKDFGGEKLPKNLELGARVLRRFASPAFLKDLNPNGDGDGYGNYPEFARMLIRIGQAMAEDQLVVPGTQPSQPKSMEDVFYPQKQP